MFSDTLKWHARNLTLGVPRNWAQTVVTWNLALHPDGTPHNGGCDTCTGVVSVNPDGTVTRNAEYYTLGHLARFVQPGAVRVASSSYGSTGWNGLPMSAAFVNPDGSTALVVNNEYDDPRTIAISVGDHHLDYTLPGGSLATFTWPASAHLTSGTAGGPVDDVDDQQRGRPRYRRVSDGRRRLDPVDLRDRPGARPVAAGRPRPPAARTPGRTGRRSGDVRLPQRRPAVDRLPARLRLSVSSDGSQWTDVRNGVGTGQLTTLKTPHNAIRYVRVTLTQADGHWWQVADVRVYR